MEGSIIERVKYCINRDGLCNGCKYTTEYNKNSSCKLLHDSELLFKEIYRLQRENEEYKRKFEDGELVSKEWHDEQVGHAELVMKEQQAEIERLTEELKYYRGELQ